MSTRRFKTAAALGATALLLSVLAGCGGNSSPSGNTGGTGTEEGGSPSPGASSGGASSGGGKSQEISFAIWGSDSPNAKQVEETFKQVIADYEKKSGNQIDFNFVPDANYRTWTMTQQAADNLPDVMKTKLAWVWEDYAKEKVIDLGPYLDKENPYNPGKTWKETFNPQLIQGVVNPANNVINSVPDEVVMVRIYYNKKLFEQVGIDKTPVTWQELMDDCQKLKDAGIIPFSFANTASIDSHASWFLGSIIGQLDQGLRDQMDMNKDGVIVNNEFARATDEGLIDFGKPPFKDGFEMFKQFSQYWNEDYNGTDIKTAESLWLAGRTAMIALGSWQMGEVDVQGRDFDYGVFPMPVITKETNPNAMGKSVVLGGKANESWAITTKATGDKLNASVDFIQYLTSPEVEGKFAAELNWMPTIDNAELPEKMAGFKLQDNEDILRANYFGPATLKEFSDYLVKALQLYLPGHDDFATFAGNLNKQWKTGMDTAKETNKWTAENHYGMNGS